VSHRLCMLLLPIPPTTRASLLPYTTLFRSQVATILSERGINIESIMQMEVEEHDGLVPMILVTHRVLESRIIEAIAALEALDDRSEEHTSELQSREKLVCRLLLEKTKHTST